MSNQHYPAENIYHKSEILSIALSPSGSDIAYIRRDHVNGRARASLWLTSIEKETPSRQLTRSGNARFPVWSPDGSALAFLSTRARDPTREGDQAHQTGQRQVWVLDTNISGVPRRLTDLPYGAKAFDWGPNGDRLVIAAPDPESRETHPPKISEAFVTDSLNYKPYLGNRPNLDTRLFVVNLQTQTVEKIPDAVGGGVLSPHVGMQPKWNPNSDEIAYISNKSAKPDDAYELDVFLTTPDGDHTVVTDGNVIASRPRWSPSGGRLGFIAEDPEDKYTLNELCVTNEGKTTYTAISEQLDRSVGTRFLRPDNYEWVTENTLVAIIPDHAKTRFMRFNLHDETTEEDSAPTRILNDQGTFQTVRRLDYQCGSLVAVVDTPTEQTLRGTELGDSDREASFGDLAKLVTLNADLVPDSKTPTMRKFSFESTDGETVEGLAYFPSDDPPVGGYPTVVHVHHGIRGFEEPKFELNNIFWTDRGYAFLRINFRGSGSYGYDFAAEIDAEWGTQEVSDLLAGVEYATEQGWTNPDESYLIGFSRGAITSGHLVAETDRFSAAVLDRGIYDYYSSFGTTSLHKWHESEFGFPANNESLHENVSSIYNIEQIDTPCLVIAGGHDTFTPSDQSKQLYARLKRRGVPSRLVLYPKYGHFLPAKGEVHRLNQIAQWFSEHRGGSK